MQCRLHLVNAARRLMIPNTSVAKHCRLNLNSSNRNSTQLALCSVHKQHTPLQLPHPGSQMSHVLRAQTPLTAAAAEDAEQDPNKQQQIGWDYQHGLNGRSKDLTRALQWYRKAADQGHAKAQCHVGYFYSNGFGIVSVDDKQALEWFRKAALQGDSQAQFNVMVCVFSFPVARFLLALFHHPTKYEMLKG